MAETDRPSRTGSKPSVRPPALPRDRRAHDPSDVDVAAAAVAVWRDVDTALRPVIGQRGVVALFNRSVQLTAAAHPWLGTLSQDPQAEFQFSAVADLFSQQEEPAAVAGGDALLLAFHQLLSSLIGASLTERLLRPAFSLTTGASPRQDSAS
jgi:hypothetical protein